MKRVLFVCVENSCRSQMAQALAKMEDPGIQAYSAGSKPSGIVNPKAIESMAELGYDLSTHRSTGLDQLPSGPFDAAVTMGCGDTCPAVRANRREDWAIPDPKHMTKAQFRQVRDTILKRVQQLLRDLRSSPVQRVSP